MRRTGRDTAMVVLDDVVPGDQPPPLPTLDRDPLDGVVAVQARADAVDAARGEADEWAERVECRQLEVQSLVDGAAARVLDEPETAAEVARETQTARDALALEEQAAAAQRPRVASAERAYLTACADAYAAAIAKLDRWVAGHDEETRRLLGLVEAHAGVLVGDVQVSTGSVAEPVRRRAEELRRQEMLLRAMASGQDLAPLVASWGVGLHEVAPAVIYGPDAVVPAQDWVNRVVALEAKLDELRELAAGLPGEVADWEQRQAREPHLLLDGLARRRGLCRLVGEWLAEAGAELLALTGQPADVDLDPVLQAQLDEIVAESRTRAALEEQTAAVRRQQAQNVERGGNRWSR